MKTKEDSDTPENDQSPTDEGDLRRSKLFGYSEAMRLAHRSKLENDLQIYVDRRERPFTYRIIKNDNVNQTVCEITMEAFGKLKREGLLSSDNLLSIDKSVYDFFLPNAMLTQSTNTKENKR